MDPDTEDSQLVYEITVGPMHGYVENKLQPGRAAATFTQGGFLGAWRGAMLKCCSHGHSQLLLQMDHLVSNRPPCTFCSSRVTSVTLNQRASSSPCPLPSGF